MASGSPRFIVGAYVHVCLMSRGMTVIARYGPAMSAFVFGVIAFSTEEASALTAVMFMVIMVMLWATLIVTCVVADVV